MRKRLAIFLPSLMGGGAERAMVLLVNRFISRSYLVDLVLAKAEGPYLNEVSEQVRIVDLKASRVLSGIPALVTYLRREQPAAILSALNYANIAAVIACYLAGSSTRIIVSERNNFSASLKNTRSASVWIMSWLMRWAYRQADSVVAISEGVADDLAARIGLPRSAINVIYNPVVTKSLLRMADQLIEHSWFRHGEPPVILGVGRLEPQKDFFTLINAFALLRNTHSARLLILGEGSLRSELEQQVRKLGLEHHVLLPGFVANPFPYMKQASLFVFSSAWEGLGNVLIQVMACGTPVVSTDCPSGPSEILEGGQWGRLVPVGDELALSKAMADTLDEKDHPDVTQRAAYFSVDRAVEGYLSVI